jgi:hypothetical protein
MDCHFKANLRRFKERFNLISKTKCGTTGDVNMDVVNNFKQNEYIEIKDAELLQSRHI